MKTAGGSANWLHMIEVDVIDKVGHFIAYICVCRIKMQFEFFIVWFANSDEKHISYLAS